MMKCLLPLLLLLGPLVSPGEDLQNYLIKTQQLVREGKYEEALERYVWFHHHVLEYEPALAGVRLSFALSYWKDLGDVYPPALRAMRTIRDEKTRQLENGRGNRNLFQDVVALNRRLGQYEKSVRLFRQLDQQQPKLAKACWRFARTPVFRAKAYDLAAAYVGDPVREFDKLKTEYEQNIKRYGQEYFGEQYREWNENRLVTRSVQLIEVALALGNEQAARAIQQKALATVDDDRIRDAVNKERAGDSKPKGRS
jgi:tetratricopeptide (TPR) repeat protein